MIAIPFKTKIKKQIRLPTIVAKITIMIITTSYRIIKAHNNKKTKTLNKTKSKAYLNSLKVN